MIWKAMPPGIRTAAATVAVLACGAEQSGTTQSRQAPESALPSLDADYLGRGQYARMHALLDKTILGAVYDMLPAWFEFLDERGMKEGDHLLYRIRNDTVRTVFRARGGVNLLDQADPTGAERRDALLAGYFAPASELREPLIRSLFDAEE